MHYLITGHTGFKGAWLSLLLTNLGHTVSGISLEPAPGALFETAELADLFEHDIRVDIRDASATSAAIARVSPDVVLHLAAQPLVRQSYLDPRVTFETNVMGTLNVLDAVSATDAVLAQVIVTTDKVYRNVTRVAGYTEDDSLGGDDPYSASKAMADLLTQSWTKSFPGRPTAIVRGGNVIAGGDVSKDRLLPDLIESYRAKKPAHIRYPQAVRPWQHVLDCLTGYIVVADALLAGGGTGAWNIGPGPESFVTVREVADITARQWGNGAAWTTDHDEHPHEAHLLALDATKVTEELGWHNRLPFPACLEWTIEWQKAVDAGESPRSITERQIATFGTLT